ncbi:YebC/PmpR family DNA-binding transcriptional regulator [Candidatus Peregrinibacteria bacterium]|nr:YebC/PmpR family DNA-binding transcriptional regulator [Candidatus Peregrinibacteria bacterium]
MARHSKWHNIKHHKMAADYKKGKVFTKHAKLIAMAARGGGDPDHNPLLKSMIENARAENVPNDNIERAIKKGTGEDKNAAVFEELIYEGFGPGGVAMLIQVLTDKKNRALGNIRTIMGKNGGRMGEAGSVAWGFKKVGVILLEIPEGMQSKLEELELALIDWSALDVVADGYFLRALTMPEDLGRIRKAALERGLRVDSAEISYEAANKVEIDDKSAAELNSLIEKIEAEDDVMAVFTNAEYPLNPD